MSTEEQRERAIRFKKRKERRKKERKKEGRKEERKEGKKERKKERKNKSDGRQMILGDANGFTRHRSFHREGGTVYATR